MKIFLRKFNCIFNPNNLQVFYIFFVEKSIYIDYNYYMKVFFKMKFLSLFVMFFLVFNIVSMILTNIKYSKISDLSITEQFFSGRNFSSDIVEKLFLQKIQGNKQHKKQMNQKRKIIKKTVFC